jgi:hypothetical protein
MSRMKGHLVPKRQPILVYGGGLPPRGGGHSRINVSRQAQPLATTEFLTETSHTRALWSMEQLINFESSGLQVM